MGLIISHARMQEEAQEGIGHYSLKKVYLDLLDNTNLLFKFRAHYSYCNKSLLKWITLHV